jgi:1,4-alpha-glucan branching enzyme
MKFMKNKRKSRSNAHGQAENPVQMEFDHPTATTVAIAGTFNNRRPGVTPMVSLGDGRWVKELVLLPGVYEYRYVVDGKRMPELFVEVVV